MHKLELARGLQGRRRLEPKTCTNTYEKEAAKKSIDPAALPADFLRVLTAQLDELKGREDSLTDVPKLIAVADGANTFVPGDDPGTPRLLVLDYQVSGRRVHVDVEYGHLGWHRRAVGAKRRDSSDLTTRSPMQDYRLEFLVPDRGTRGYIVSETISGGHALPMLVSWLNHVGRQEQGDDSMVRLLAHSLTDIDRVLRLLEKPDSVAEIELQRASGAHNSKDGAPTSGRITVKEQLLPGSKIQQIRQLLGQWQQDGFTYDQSGKLTQVRALAEVVDPDIGELEFTDGIIRLDTDTGRTLSVRPTKLGELYNYDISDSRPSSALWADRVKPRIEALAAGDDEVSVVWG